MKFKHFLNENKEPKYKIGTEVMGVGTGQSKNLDGLKGIIKYYNQGQNYLYYGVCWDKYINGHSGAGRCKAGHAWEVEERNIKPLKPKSRFDKEMKVEI